MTRREYKAQSRVRFIDDAKLITHYVQLYEHDEMKKIIGIADDVTNQSFMFNLRWDMERTHEKVSFEGGIDWMHQPGDDSEWVFAFNRMRFWICLGQAYAITGDEKYAKAFASQLCDWVRKVQRNDPACAKAWRSIEAGLRMEYWTKAMQYFQESPAITEEVMDIFLHSVAEHAAFLYSVWDSYHLMSNWGVLENHGLLLASLALPDSPLVETYRMEALRRLEAEIRLQVYDDGVQWEQSPMYHNEVAHDFLDVVMMATKNHFHISETFKDKTHQMCLASMAWQKPNGSEPCMGDSDDIDQRDILSKGAFLFHDGRLKGAGYAHLDFDCIWDLGFAAAVEYDRLPSIKERPMLSVLEESGNAVARLGKTYLRFHCGTLGAGHGHSDKLHLDVYANGEDILVDAGRYTYVPKAERYEFKDSTAHNTTIVDGQNFTVCKDSWECSKLSAPLGFRAKEKHGYAAMQGSHLGYADNGALPKRTLVQLREDLILICDALYAKDEHTYQNRFHFNNEGEVSLDDDGSHYRSSLNEVQILSASATGVVQHLEKSRLSRHYNELSDNITLVGEVFGEGFQSMFTLISINRKDEFEPAELRKIPVSSNFKKIPFPDSWIEAVEIEKGAASFTVVVGHQEWATPTDTFNARGCIGFGSLVVFDRAQGEKEIGIRLFG